MMKYFSSRDNTLRLSASRAIYQGLSEDGGLFVPDGFHRFSREELEQLIPLNYQQMAVRVLESYLDDFTKEEVSAAVAAAYSTGFDSPQTAPTVSLDETTHILELWHGPTHAFKDMALQLLPHLMTLSAAKTGDGREVVILVATSGDTGKAALEGFKDVPGTRIMVFYPRDGVSDVQKLQMTTQQGGNVWVESVHGNFDDAQSGVKAIFTDAELKRTLSEKGFVFSSANSINLGRLIPQIVYYFYSYFTLVREGKLALGDKVNIVVPTGNFGNILAAYYGMKMGLPVRKFICASNKNKVLTDFFLTGCYSLDRTFYTTMSPSMDILISSNLERLLCDLCDGDSDKVKKLYTELKQSGSFQVDEETKTKMDGLFYGGFCDEEQTAETIRRVFEEKNYCLDPHSAVAYHVLEQYRAQTGDGTPAIVASTANPYKFSDSVLTALGGLAQGKTGLQCVELLHERIGLPVPEAITRLKTSPVRFTASCEAAEMKDAVLQFLGGKA